jgi:hypothetical protein
MDVAAIKKVFVESDVPLTKDDIWRVQQAWVIKHSALERLGAKLGIWFDDPVMMQGPATGQFDGSYAMFVRGYRKVKGESLSEWSIGEVNPSNYRTSGKQPSYPWAMLEKRAKDRVLIKLAGLHGAYSEDEADDFSDKDKKSFPKPEEVEAKPEPARERPEPSKPAPLKLVKTDTKDPADDVSAQGEMTVSLSNNDSLTEEQRDVCGRVIQATEIDQVSDLMMSPEVQAILTASNPNDRKFVRQFAAHRMRQLGWLAPAKEPKHVDAGG